MIASFKPVSLSTPRLNLRPVAVSDAAFFSELRSQQDVNKLVGRQLTCSLIEARAFIERLHMNADAGVSIYWLIEELEAKEPVGGIGIFNFSDNKRTAEVGFELMPSAQRRGFMKEALRETGKFLFGKIGLDKLIAFADKSNIPSIKTLTGAGFEVNQTLISDHEPERHIGFEWRRNEWLKGVSGA